MNKNDIVFNTFEQGLHTHGISIDSVDETDLIFCTYQEIEFKVSLDNARKDYELTGSLEVVHNIVEIIAANVLFDIEDFDSLKDSIFPHLIPFDMEIEADNITLLEITRQANMIYVINHQGQQIYIMDSLLQDWKKSSSDISHIGFTNLTLELNKTNIEVQLIEDRKLGFFDTEFSLKSSLLVSHELQNKVKSEFGWPIYAVFPVKDFCYIFSENDFYFFSSRLGETVLQEFNNSPHPVSTEIIKISDDGIEAIGEYKN